MLALAGPFTVAAALLGAGGASKVLRPANTARALGEMGLPSSTRLVQLGAAAEVVVAAGALLARGGLVVVSAALVTISYLAFAGFVAAALRRGVPLSSCGCFGGAEDTPPTVTHLVLNLAAAAVAGAVAVGSDGAGMRQIAGMDGPVVLRGLFLVLTGMSVWFAYVALTLLPRVLGAGERAVR